MPNWNYHLAFSFGVYIILAIIFNLSIFGSAIGLVILAFASLLPDFDHPKSLIRQITAIAAGFGSFIVLLKLLTNFDVNLSGSIVVSTIAALCAYFGVKKIRLKHRGKNSMHQLWVLVFVAVFSAFVFWLFNLQIYFSALVFLGYGSHMFLDWAKKQLK